MARPIICDMCHEKEAACMYTVFADGTTIAVCEDDAPGFAIGLAISLGALPDPTDITTDQDSGRIAGEIPDWAVQEMQFLAETSTHPDPVTDEPTDEPVDVAVGPVVIEDEAPPKRRRRSAA